MLDDYEDEPATNSAWWIAGMTVFAGAGAILYNNKNKVYKDEDHYEKLIDDELNN